MQRIITPIVLFFCLIIVINAKMHTTKLINFTCKQTGDPKLCITTLKNDARSISAKKMVNLAELLVSKLNDQGGLTVKQILLLQSDPKTDWTTMQYLNKCEDLYAAILIIWIKGTRKSLTEKDYKSAVRNVSKVLVDVQRCDKGFEVQGHVKSPIPDGVTKLMYGLFEISYDVIYYLWNHHS